MKRLTVAILVYNVFTPTVVAQTVERTNQVPSPTCILVIRRTQQQCENVITPTAEQAAEKSLPGRKGAKAQAKRLTPEPHRAGATKGSNAAANRPVYFLETVSGPQIRDIEDSPTGPIMSVAR